MKMFGTFRCWLARGDLTALAEGELRPWRASWVSGHVEGCAGCASLYDEIQKSVNLQRGLLRRAMDAAPRSDVVRMLREVRGRLAEDAEPSRRWVWQPAAVGALAVAALAVLFFVRDVERQPGRPRSAAVGRAAKGPVTAPGVEQRVEGAGASSGQEQKSESLGGQEALARADRLPRPTLEIGAGSQDRRSPEELPSELLAKPDLFVDYGMMVRLEALENFEHVRSLPETDSSDTQQAG
jgi:hypothetical protein